MELRQNSPLQPMDVMSGSHKKIWWLGKCGHEWQTSVFNRVAGKGCPYCCGQCVLIGFNDLGTTHFYLAKEWHPTKNGEFTPQNVSAGSNRKVWWMCQNKHEWTAVVASRVRGNGCPVCAKEKRKKQYV